MATAPAPSSQRSLRQRVQDNSLIFFVVSVAGAWLGGYAAYPRILPYLGKTIVERPFGGPRPDENAQKNQIPQAKKIERNPEQSKKDEQPGPAELRELKSELDSFVKNQPVQPYQWTGFTNDIDQLYSTTGQLLDYLGRHPRIKYADVEPIYEEMDKAAAAITLRAFNTFNASKDEDPKKTPDQIKIDFDQKVYVGPSLFQIHVHNLAASHEEGRLSSSISERKNEFAKWRRYECGI